MEPGTKTCGPYPGCLIWTHTQMEVKIKDTRAIKHLRGLRCVGRSGVRSEAVTDLRREPLIMDPKRGGGKHGWELS